MNSVSQSICIHILILLSLTSAPLVIDTLFSNTLLEPKNPKQSKQLYLLKNSNWMMINNLSPLPNYQEFISAVSITTLCSLYQFLHFRTEGTSLCKSELEIIFCKKHYGWWTPKWSASGLGSEVAENTNCNKARAVFANLRSCQSLLL